MAEQPQATWTEAESRDFIDLANIAVPGRAEQVETLLSLIPAAETDEFHAAELACGEGLLAERLLSRFPGARLVAFDGSDVMLAAAQRRLSPFGDRAALHKFDLSEEDWLDHLKAPLRCVLTSLAIHHLTDDAKRSLYTRIAGRLDAGGALLIADVVRPANAAARRAVVSAWHRIAQEQSLAQTGALDAYHRAATDGWGPPETDEPEPGEMPARLSDHLVWLKDAGFRYVDCFWMRAGISVYGGYR